MVGRDLHETALSLMRPPFPIEPHALQNPTFVPERGHLFHERYRMVASELVAPPVFPQLNQPAMRFGPLPSAGDHSCAPQYGQRGDLRRSSTTTKS